MGFSLMRAMMHHRFMRFGQRTEENQRRTGDRGTNQEIQLS